MDFGDTGMELGAYERLPSMSTFMSGGRMRMDYPLDGSDPADSLYGQSRTPNMGAHMSNGSSQTNPFITPPTHIPNIPCDGLSMEPANNSADVLEAFGSRDQPAASVEGNLGRIAAEGRASLPSAQPYQDNVWGYGQQEQNMHQGCGSQ